MIKSIAIHGRFRSESSNGIDRTIGAHLIYLRKRGHKVDLISFSKPNEADQKCLDDLGVRVHVINSSLLGAFRGFWKLRGKYDLIMLHSVFVKQNWIAVIASGCKWSVTPHGGYSPGQISYRRPRLKRLALALFERWILRNALAVHVLSSAEENQIRMLAPDAVTVISPNGSDPQIQAIPLEKKDRMLRLLFIGRVEYMHKGLDLLLKALAHLKPGSIHIDIVGPAETGDLAYLKNLVVELMGRNTVAFHGPLYGEEKLNLIKRSHVFVHTSRWEGMPFSVIEALQLGRPVFVTPETNMGDIIGAYDAGWVVNLSDIGSGLRCLIETPFDEIERKAINAALLAREVLSWDMVSGKLFSGIEVLLDRVKK